MQLMQLMQLPKVELPTSAPFYKPAAPFHGAILRAKHVLNANQSLNKNRTETCHCLVDLTSSRIQYLEGQSIGFLAPGADHNGKAHKLRLYSIASSRFGETSTRTSNCAQNVAFTVKRVLEFDRQDPHEIVRKGVATNYLLDLPLGSKLRVTGPVGKAFVLPQNPHTNLVLVATGTGIATFRAFLQYANEAFNNGWPGQIFLFFGARCEEELFYCNSQNQDILQYSQNCPNVHLFFARSRDQKNSENGRLYVSDLIWEQRNTMFDLLSQKPSHNAHGKHSAENGVAVYLCGLRAMAKSVEQTIVRIINEREQDGDDWLRQMKLEKRWNIDVY